jgi:hypothetical protein
MPRGWLLLLCIILLVWQPLSFAVEAAGTLPTLGVRGLQAIVEIAAHGIVAALSFAAGWALWQASPAGPRLAVVVLVACAVTGVQSLYWTVLPSNVFPGDRLALASVIVLHSAAWIVYLRRSKHVRQMVEG